MWPGEQDVHQRDIHRLTGDFGDPSLGIWGGPFHDYREHQKGQRFPVEGPLFGIPDPWSQELSEGVTGGEEPPLLPVEGKQLRQLK